MSDRDVRITYDATLNTTIEVAEYDATPAEFERFEDFAAKLVQVPKTELDEKLKES